MIKTRYNFFGLEFVSLYGEKYARDESIAVSYYYDLTTGKFLGEETLKNSSEDDMKNQVFLVLFALIKYRFRWEIG